MHHFQVLRKLKNLAETYILCTTISFCRRRSEARTSPAPAPATPIPLVFQPTQPLRPRRHFMPPTSSTLSIRSSRSCPPPTRPPTSAPPSPPPMSPFANTAPRPHVCPRRLDYVLRNLNSTDHPPSMSPMSLTEITEALNNLSETGSPERSLSTPSFTSLQCDGDYGDYVDMTDYRGQDANSGLYDPGYLPPTHQSDKNGQKNDKK